MRRLFRRPYTIRRHGTQKIVNGYPVSDYSEFTTRLTVQPLSSDDLLALPEGERSIARVKTRGADALIDADEHSQTPGDMLFFQGKWYECKSCVHWLHTPMTHYESEFVLIADQRAHTSPGTGGDTVDP